MAVTLPFRTKADLAYSHVREQVLAGRLAPGERVRISHVARELGVSDIPVREAVARLQSEGLLRGEAHKGAVVARLGAHEIEELFAIRTELEALATRRAAQSLTSEQLDHLRELVEQMQTAEREQRAEDYGQLNRDFHFAIYDAQDYRRLAAMIRDLWQSTDWCRRIFERDRDSVRLSSDEHAGIYQALRRGDGDAAAALLRRQKQRSCAWLLKHVETPREEKI
jgi:DNA-binding GntR family transcriptional regulator